MDSAEIDRLLQSGFWKEYIKELNRLLQIEIIEMNEATEMHRIFRGQGAIKAYKKLMSLPEDVRKKIKGKMGSST